MLFFLVYCLADFLLLQFVAFFFGGFLISVGNFYFETFLILGPYFTQGKNFSQFFVTFAFFMVHNCTFLCNKHFPQWR